MKENRNKNNNDLVYEVEKIVGLRYRKVLNFAFDDSAILSLRGSGIPASAIADERISNNLSPAMLRTVNLICAV